MALCGHLFAEIVITTETKTAIYLDSSNKQKSFNKIIHYVAVIKKRKRKTSHSCCNVPAVFGFIISKCLFLFPPTYICICWNRVHCGVDWKNKSQFFQHWLCSFYVEFFLVGCQTRQDILCWVVIELVDLERITLNQLW